MTATNAGWFLATGILLGVISSVFGVGRQSGKLWMTAELTLSSIAGSVILSNVAAHLPGGWFAFVYTGVAFALINQVPRWFFSDGPGLGLLQTIEIVPPAFIPGLILSWAAWSLALFAASQFFIAPADAIALGAFGSEAAGLTLVTFVSVVASILGGIIRF